jgi:hypothetical protein
MEAHYLFSIDSFNPHDVMISKLLSTGKASGNVAEMHKPWNSSFFFYILTSMPLHSLGPRDIKNIYII